MKKILNYKILFIFLAFVCCFFIFTTNSKATIDVTYGDTSYVLPDVPENMPYKNYFILREGSNSFTLYNFDGDVYFADNGFFLIDSSGYREYMCNNICETYPDSTFVFFADSKLSSLTGLSLNDFVYSNVDIYNDSNKSEVVFRKASLVPPITRYLVEQTTKAEIMTQIKKVITGYLKYLIALVVSVIAFYKGYQFLLKQLRQA